MVDIIGKTICIVSSSNPILVGKTGVVVDETKQIIIVETSNGRKQILKNAVTFCVVEKDNQEKIIEGKKITTRLYDRIKG